MAFKPLSKESGKELDLLATNSTTFTKYQLVKQDATTGLVVSAADGDAYADYISLEATTTGTSETLRVLKVDPSILIEADTSTAAARTNCGDRVDILNGTHLILANTTDKVFLVSDIVPGCTTKVRGYFQQGIA